jgi:hypothetical protein
MNSDPFLKIAEGIVELIWKCPYPKISIDHSVRECISKNLIFPLAQAKALSFKSTSDAYADLLDLLDNDDELKSIILTVNQNTLREFNEHYEKFGGKSAFFAQCLFLSFTENDSERLQMAKSAVLNWYFSARKISISRLNGGIVAAWFPFGWFVDNFDAIAASVVAAGLYEISKHLIGDKIRNAFHQSVQKIRQHFNPYPDELLRAKPQDMTLDAFNKKLKEDGIVDEFLYLFQLDDEELEIAIRDWTIAFNIHFNSFSSDERHLLDKLLDKPIPIGDSEIREPIEMLRARKLVRVLETGPGEIKCAYYPEFLEV